MAESSVYDIAEQVLDKLRSVGCQKISWAWVVKRELKELEDSISSIKAVLLDAAEQMAENRQLSHWLQKCKDVFYDADDIVDELDYEALWQNGDTKRKVCDFFSRSSPLAKIIGKKRKESPLANATAIFDSKMKEIRKRLHEIEAEKGYFHLTERTEDRHVMERKRERTETDFSTQHNSDLIIGRDKDKEAIVGLLMQTSDDDDDENVPIISIVGEGDDDENVPVISIVGEGDYSEISTVVDENVSIIPIVGEGGLGKKEIRKRLREIEAKKGSFHLTERTEDDENVSIISIVGEGGLGKTTIAKLVYNDESVARHFQLKMWGHASKDFDVKKVTREIISSAIHSDCGDITLDEIQTLLQDTVRDKRFLLVLDDVWYHDDRKWNELKQNLMVGANGSKIIVTTRSMEVASYMGTLHQYHLQALPLEVSLSLFMSCAFRKGDVHQYPHLMKIGKELVKRCHGHPLSARILGSLLSSTTDERYWLSIRDSIRDSVMWKSGTSRISLALEVSYNAMPSYLKRCFSYCSIFKTGCEIIDTELIQMWIAQGFIRPFDENQELEDIGRRYFQELCSLSFFQIVEQKHLYCTFKMHDLIIDLARSVAKGECCTVSSNVQKMPQFAHHVSISSNFNVMDEVHPNFFRQLPHVRTVLVERVGQTSESDWVEMCINFKSLRVLDLSFSHYEVLPFVIGNLKHLRYLNISNNRSIKELPTFIFKLLNLQSLRLDGCWELEKLPRNVGKLINLRHLLLTTKQMFLPKEGIGNLKSLRFLGIVECANLKSLGEGMQGLTALRTLLISDCGDLEFLPSSMKHLIALETLSIENCEKLILKEWEEDIQDLRLNLQTLLITRLPQLETLPQWLQGAKNTLQLISIRDCWDLKALPEWLQYLTSLQKLEFSLCPRLWALPEGMPFLTALRELKIEDCPELNRRCEEGTGKDWPKIAHVRKIIRLERTSDTFGNRRRLLNKLLFLNQ